MYTSSMENRQRDYNFLNETYQVNGLKRMAYRVKWTSMVQWQRTGLLVNRSSDRSCTRGMIHNKIHLASLGWPKTTIHSFEKSKGGTVVAHWTTG